MNPCIRPGQCTDSGFGPENCTLCNPQHETDPASENYMRRNDSVPAFLSSGEFKVTAKAGTKIGRKFLKALNSGVDGMALGGIISSIKRHGPKK